MKGLEKGLFMPQQEPPAAPKHLFQVARRVRSIRRDPAFMAGLDKAQAAEFIKLERKVLGDEKAMVAKMRADPSEKAAVDVQMWEGMLAMDAGHAMVKKGHAMAAEGRRKFNLAAGRSEQAEMRRKLDGMEAGLAGNSGRSFGLDAPPRVEPRPINPFIGGGG